MLKRQLRRIEDEDDGMMEREEGVSEISSSSSSSEEDMSEGEGEDMDSTTKKPFSFKTKILILASRGINARQRHLMDDIISLIPNSKKESKFDSKRELFVLNEIAELHGCTHILFFESRKPQDLFIWASKAPSGPSIRFHVNNIHTMDELHLTGNTMKNTRPILTFDPIYSEKAHLKEAKSLLEAIFGIPKDHRKTRPYIDRVMHFGFADDRLWIRNYQFKEKSISEKSIDGFELEEIGPRTVLNPVKMFAASFGGRVLWSNPNYVSAASIRADIRAKQALKGQQRSINHAISAEYHKNISLPADELENVFD